MNKYNRLVINNFMAEDNVQLLYRSLVKWYDDERVYKYLTNNMRTLIQNYYQIVNEDFKYSDPIILGNGTHEVSQQLKCLNIAFKDYVDRFIKDMVFRDGLVHGNTKWDDGMYASSKGPLYSTRRAKLDDKDTSKILHSDDSGDYSKGKTADEMLNSWWYPRRPIEVRDDSVGTIGQTDDVRSLFPPRNTLTGGTPRGTQYIRGNAIQPAVPTKESYAIPTKESYAVRTKESYAIPTKESYAVRTKESYAVQNPNYTLYKHPNPGGPPTVNIPVQYSFVDPSDGPYYEVPDQEYVEVDRLLNTSKIQSLNNGGTCIKPPTTGKRYPAACSEITTEQPQNNVRIWQDTNGPVDEANQEEFKHYMNRRLFRSYNRGKYYGGSCIPQGDSAADQIPFYERALYNRYYERDVEESIGGFERDNLQRKHDLNSLRCRVDKQKAVNWKTECVNTDRRNA
jgi:hypothetical protein